MRRGGGCPARARALVAAAPSSRRRRPASTATTLYARRRPAAHPLHPLGEGLVEVPSTGTSSPPPTGRSSAVKGDVDVEAALLEVVQQVERHRRLVRHRLDERDRGVRLHQRDGADGLNVRRTRRASAGTRAVLPSNLRAAGCSFQGVVGGAAHCSTTHRWPVRQPGRTPVSAASRAAGRVARTSAPATARWCREHTRRCADCRADRHGFAVPAILGQFVCGARSASRSGGSNGFATTCVKSATSSAVVRYC